MEQSRRRLLEELLAGGGLAALLASQSTAQSETPPGASEIRPADFWGSFYDSVDPNKGRGAPKPQPAAQGKDVVYLYSEKGDEFSYADKLTKSDLLNHPGDVTIDIVLGQFRPSKDDDKTIKQYTSSQLRIDCVQTQKFLDILAPSAWVALASLFTDKAGKLPSLQQLGFQQPNLISGPSKVILPGGAGKFSVNVSSMSKESKLHEILRQGVKIAGVVSPLIGFPAISIPAAQAFTAIYSLLEERASFIMSSPLVPAAATQAAVAAANFPLSYVPLKTGNYAVVPQAHTDVLSAKLAALKLQQGYLIDPTVPANRPIDQIANDSIPDVTYVTLKLTVKPLTLPAQGSSAVSTTDSSTPAKKSTSSGAAAKKTP